MEPTILLTLTIGLYVLTCIALAVWVRKKKFNKQ